MKDHQYLPEVAELQTKVENILEPYGFEVAPFLLGWYNDKVGPKFRLDHPNDTLAMVVISRPEMFEKAFLPFLSSSRRGDQSGSLNDPIDDCMLHHLSLVTQALPNTVALHDFQVGPTRRPRVLMQTAGHVSGSVRLYQPSQFPDLKTDDGGKLFPVCHHPRHGGWFALRGVFIFKGVQVPGLERREPASLLSEEEGKEFVLLYNKQWQDWKWREVGREESASRYSHQQIKYFETSPAERLKIIDNLVDGTF